MMVRFPFVGAMLLFLAVTPAWTQNHPVVPTGAMRNTMFKGQLAGLVQLDSLASPGTYGIGPLEYLRGELLLWDGHAYVATAVGDSAMTVAMAGNRPGRKQERSRAAPARKRARLESIVDPLVGMGRASVTARTACAAEA